MGGRYMDFDDVQYPNELFGNDIKHCCNLMHYHVTNTCEMHPDRYDCPDMLVIYSPKFNEYGLIIYESHSYVLIEYCPWCGTKLPESKRDEWFDIIESLGFEPDDDETPAIYKTDAWYRK